MTDLSSNYIAKEPLTTVLTGGDKPAVQTPPPGDPPVTAFKGDSLRLPATGVPARPVSLFGDPTKPAPAPDKGDRPWRLTSVTARYTAERAIYGKSDIHFKQPAFGTDLVIKDVEAQDRTSFEYFYTMPNGWPQIDEPQTSIGISGTFANGYGVEANLKHNKYIVRVPGQQNQYDGTIGGQEVHGVKPLSDFVGQYEISGGLNQVSIMGTKSLPLPAFSPKDRFSLILKAGPGALITYTNSHLKNADGVMEEGPHNYHLGGYSFVGETELRYEVRKRVALSLTNSLSYCNVTSSQIAGGGKATQQILIGQIAAGIGYTFNVKDKPKKPVDPTQ